MYKDMYKIHGDLNTWIQKATLLWAGRENSYKWKFINKSLKKFDHSSSFAT